MHNRHFFSFGFKEIHTNQESSKDEKRFHSELFLKTLSAEPALNHSI